MFFPTSLHRAYTLSLLLCLSIFLNSCSSDDPSNEPDPPDLSNCDDFPSLYRISNRIDLERFGNLYGGCGVIEGTIVFQLREDVNTDVLKTITEVTGDLLILEVRTEGVDMSGFSNVRRVGGDFDIQANSLEVIEGFEALQEVGGDFNIVRNRGTRTVRGFNALRQVGGKFLVEQNQITELSGFDNLAQIGGNVQIQNNDNLLQVDLFRNLTSISGDLEFFRNESLEVISGFGGSFRLGGELRIDDNRNLLRIDGFQDIIEVQGSFFIQFNPRLEDLSTFGNLSTVRGDIFRIQANESLTALPLFDSLREVSGLLRIEQNSISALNGFNALESSGGVGVFDEPLESFEGFNALETINGDLTIGALPLPDIDAFQNLRTIVEGFRVSQMPNMQNLDFAAPIRTVGYVQFLGNDALLDFRGLSGLESIAGEFEVRLNPALISTEGASSLRTIGDRLWIEQNQSLENLAGFESLQSLTDLEVFSNNSLRMVSGFDALTQVGRFNIALSSAEADQVTVSGFPALQRVEDIFAIVGAVDVLDGFSGLRNVVGSFVLTNTVGVSNLSNFSSLEETSGGIFIRNNDALENLNGINGVGGIVESIRIQDNDVLNDVSGLVNIQQVNDNIVIADNSMLSSCSILLICDHIANGRDIDFLRNMAGCNSLEEVSQNCN